MIKDLSSATKQRILLVGSMMRTQILTCHLERSLTVLVLWLFCTQTVE
ncbi:Uncharacterised protein [Klebsiella pneumoniae]|nr:Uncharacterised protein [Klebsiella pneumoniae]SVM29471.1 Uncharacterised protein [Klebsiella pneumoniae]